MSGLNRAIIQGNVGKRPEVKTFENGTKKASFSIATSKTFKRENGEKVTNTEWHNVIAWGKTAEIVEKYVDKGSTILIEGELRTTSWEKDSVTHYRTHIDLTNLVLISKPKNEANGESNEITAPESGSPESDDLPF